MGYKKLPALVIPTDLAILGYLAGLVDGEGHIGITTAFSKKNSLHPSHSIRVVVTNTDCRMLTWLRDALGGGLFEMHHRGRKANWKDSYHWVVNGQNAEDFLRAVLPHLVVKREQAKVALELRSIGRGKWKGRGLDPQVVEQREALKQRMHVLNQRGKPEGSEVVN